MKFVIGEAYLTKHSVTDDRLRDLFRLLKDISGYVISDDELNLFVKGLQHHIDKDGDICMLKCGLKAFLVRQEGAEGIYSSGIYFVPEYRGFKDIQIILPVFPINEGNRHSKLDFFIKKGGIK